MRLGDLKRCVFVKYQKKKKNVKKFHNKCHNAYKNIGTSKKKMSHLSDIQWNTRRDKMMVDKWEQSVTRGFQALKNNKK